jgi:hypothetical protein
MKNVVTSYENYFASSVPYPYILVVNFDFIVLLLESDILARYVKLETEF